MQLLLGRFSFPIILCLGFVTSIFPIQSLQAQVGSKGSWDHSHALWTQVLKTYVNPEGLVRYAQIKKDSTGSPQHPFNKYVMGLQDVTYSQYLQFSRDQQLAFLINSYNAMTVKLILDHYPVKSIKKIGGFFSKPWGLKFFKLLDGKIESLDPIEHEWIRPKFKDLRIHAAVNCASISCPRLRGEAYVAENLNSQLDQQMKIWLQDSSRNQIQADGKVVFLSKIFDWYKKDFVDWGKGVLTVVQTYSDSSVIQRLDSNAKIKYLDYDWSLNEARP